MLSYPDINEALRLGMHEFAKMSDVKGSSFPMNVMVARRSFVEKNRDTVKRFQQAYAEGTYQFMTNKEKGVAVLIQAAAVQKSQRPSKKPINYFAQELFLSHPGFPRGLRNTLEIIAQRTPRQSRHERQPYLDESISTNWNAKDFLNDLRANS